MHIVDLIEIAILTTIYQFRCLTGKQIKECIEIYFEKEFSDAQITRKINALTKNNYLEKIEYEDKKFTFFLNTNGVDIVKKSMKLPTTFLNPKYSAKRGYLRASELRILAKNIPHQLHLNQFVINFLRKINAYNNSNPENQVQARYFDEKHMAQYSSMRPDGMIRIGDYDFYLEMDLGTESKKQLLQKWEHYRIFLNSAEYKHSTRKVIVIFIVENVLKKEKRINLVKASVTDSIIDIFDPSFEMHIGTTEKMIELLSEYYVPIINSNSSYIATLKSILEKHNFDVHNGEVISKKLFDGSQYLFYCKKSNENGNVIVDNGRVQEFMIDHYLYAPVSVLHKISYLNYHNVFFNEILKRKLSYLVIVESEKQIAVDLRLAGVLEIENVYFTTLRRLNIRQWHEAIFQVDVFGNVFSFTDNSLQEKIHEGTIVL